MDKKPQENTTLNELIGRTLAANQHSEDFRKAWNRAQASSNDLLSLMSKEGSVTIYYLDDMHHQVLSLDVTDHPEPLEYFGGFLVKEHNKFFRYENFGETWAFQKEPLLAIIKKSPEERKNDLFRNSCKKKVRLGIMDVGTALLECYKRGITPPKFSPDDLKMGLKQQKMKKGKAQ